MTEILNAPGVGTPPFEHTHIHSSSYPDLATLETSLPRPDKSGPKSPYVHAEYEKQYASSVQSSAPSSPTYTYFSRDDSDSTPPSSLMGHIDDDGDHPGGEDDLIFPSYDQYVVNSKHTTASTPTASSSEQPRSNVSAPTTITTSSANTNSSPPSEEPATPADTVNDDQAIEPEPTRHVDYLSHDWREEDIWSSWRYIVSRRKKISNSARLENAAWRTWMKTKYDLDTVTPEALNWLKDCDVTWLYGPLQIRTKKSLMEAPSPRPCHLSTSSSFLCKKPILKKKSASAVILERSRSQHSLLQRASEIIRQQQSSPALGRPPLRSGEDDFPLPSYPLSSVTNTPAGLETPSTASHRRWSFIGQEPQTPAEEKHVLFDETVRQVQAIESDEDEKGPDAFAPAATADEAAAAATTTALVTESDEDDDGGLMMIPSTSRNGSVGGSTNSKRSTPRSSFGNESKTIAPLPSTKLKKGRGNTPEPPSSSAKSNPIWLSGRRLSPSPSQETLRPTRPNQNFLIDDDPELNDEPWLAPGSDYSPFVDEDPPGPPMRRTDSGMFMPYDENEEDDAVMNQTLFGQAMYAVNTFKDIAHVVWNVGWTRK